MQKGGEEVSRMIKGYIYAKFKSEAECARKLGWNRQKLNRITTGKSLPSITELNELANVLEEDSSTLLHIFLSA